MADLPRDDIIKLARLARIDVTDDEVNEYARELGAILEYVEQLQAVDVSGLKPTSQTTGLTNVVREDVVQDYGYTPEDLLTHSLSVQDRQLKVKRMLG